MFLGLGLKLKTTGKRPKKCLETKTRYILDRCEQARTLIAKWIYLIRIMIEKRKCSSSTAVITSSLDCTFRSSPTPISAPITTHLYTSTLA